MKITLFSLLTLLIISCSIPLTGIAEYEPALKLRSLKVLLHALGKDGQMRSLFRQMEIRLQLQVQ